MQFEDKNSNKKDFNEILKDVMHDPQPHTMLGIRGQQEIKLKKIHIAECFLRGMLEGGTYYNLDKNGKLTNRIDVEKLEYHHLIDIIYEVEWMKDFDPVAIIQCAGCHLEKVLGIYPNVPKLNTDNTE